MSDNFPTQIGIGTPNQIFVMWQRYRLRNRKCTKASFRY